MTNARQYCQMINDHFYAPRLGPIPAPAALLLEHGREWTERRFTGWRGTPKACFANAQYLARTRKGLRYVEGFATRMIPVEHAWCIDAEGRVIDPTWDAGEADYFGIAFDREAVRRVRKITGRSYSLLFTWWKWPEVYRELKTLLKN